MPDKLSSNDIDQDTSIRKQVIKWLQESRSTAAISKKLVREGWNRNKAIDYVNQVKKEYKRERRSRNREKVKPETPSETINSEIYVGKKRSAFLVGLASTFIPGFSSYYGYCASKEICQHEGNWDNADNQFFAVNNALLCLLFFTPIGMIGFYKIAKRCLRHYSQVHNAFRGDPESDEVDVYGVSVDTPISNDLTQRTSFVRTEPRHDFFGGQPGLIVGVCFLIFPILIFMFGFPAEIQRSLNSHWTYHARLGIEQKKRVGKLIEKPSQDPSSPAPEPKGPIENTVEQIEAAGATLYAIEQAKQKIRKQYSDEEAEELIEKLEKQLIHKGMI
jgi:hypothetical protein